MAAGCGGGGSSATPASVTAPQATGAIAAHCADLVADLPDSVGGQDSRPVSPASHFAAAWGDPPIVLTCGGPAPKALRPTSQCYGVDGVGWLVTQHGREVRAGAPLAGELDFTTIGRTPYVAVRVPAAYQPAADALVDVAAAIKRRSTLEHPCQ